MASVRQPILTMQRIFGSHRCLHVARMCTEAAANTGTATVKAAGGQASDSSIQRHGASLASKFKKAASAGNKRPLFITSENNPANHTSRHEGFYYTVSSEDFNRWMSAGQHHHCYKMAKAFNETCLMVRQPATEILQCIRVTDFTTPVIRYVLYGRAGTGRSMSLAHIIHACGSQNWLVAHVPWAPFFNRYYREIQPSTHRPGRLDQPVDAVNWLTAFRKMNEPLLKELNLTSTNQYTWSKRDVTEVGAPLLPMIDFGMSRAKYACDVMGALLKELRLQASVGRFRLLVAVDGVNAFWMETSIMREDNRHKKHHCSELTIVHNLKKMLSNNWSGGAVVCTVDGMAKEPADITKYLPLELLGKEGFECLDPFLPVHVDNYTEKEAYSCLQYFIDRKWIQNPIGDTEEGQREILSTSNRNPLEMFLVTVNW